MTNYVGITEQNYIVEAAPRQNFGLNYSPSMTMNDLEKMHIVNVLVSFNGNKTRAAKSLGFTLKTLYNKLVKYDLTSYINKRDAHGR